MPGLDTCNVTNQSDQLLSSPSSQTARSRVKHNESADSASSVNARRGLSGVTVDLANKHSSGVRKFTSKELSQLNQRHNAHVAYRGKVPIYV